MSLSWLGPEKQIFSKFNNLQYISDTLECTGSGCDSDFFSVATHAHKGQMQLLRTG